jgi:arginine exporter protein ArgO
VGGQAIIGVPTSEIGDFGKWAFVIGVFGISPYFFLFFYVAIVIENAKWVDIKPQL